MDPQERPLADQSEPEQPAPQSEPLATPERVGPDCGETNVLQAHAGNGDELGGPADPDPMVAGTNAAILAALAGALACPEAEADADTVIGADADDPAEDAFWSSFADDPADHDFDPDAAEPDASVACARSEAICGSDAPPANPDDRSLPVPPEGSPDFRHEPAAIDVSAQLVPIIRDGCFEIRHLNPLAEEGNLRVTYGFVVRNTAPVTLANVRVEHTLPEGTHCIGISPTPEVHTNRMVWQLGDVESGEERQFRIRVEREPGAELPRDATAILHACYRLKTSLSLPRLELVVAPPAAVKRGEAAVFEIELKNSGTAPAEGAVLRALLPAGLEAVDGAAVEAVLGSVAPGGIVRITLRLNAIRAGTQRLVLEALAGDGIQTAAEGEVEVIEALLAVTAHPVRCHVETPAEYRVEAMNPGTAPIAQAVLIDALPAELEFLGASEGGEFDPSDRSITWVLRELGPAQVHPFTVRFQANLAGEYTHRLLAWSDCGLEAQAEATVNSEIEPERSSRILEELLANLERAGEAADDLAIEPQERPRGSAQGSRGRQFVVFTVGATDYAVPIENVLEYGHTLAITPLPNVPDWLLGVANLHGDIISMVDLRSYLGQQNHRFQQEGRMLIVRPRSQELTVGLIVDRVNGLRVVAADCISPPASHLEDRLGPYYRGVADHQGRLLVLLNLDQLLLSDEMRQFEPV